MHTMGINRLPGSLHPGNSTLRTTALITAITAWLLAAGQARADGCFVFVWNKQKDINEPTQKAILLHDQGREDLVLQVKYEGPAEDFGWLVPVPGLPEVRKGSMECFYELSRLTQERWSDRQDQSRATLGAAEESRAGRVKVIEIKTVGAYEVAVLSSGNAASLAEWLEANHFVFPKDKQGLLDSYVQKHWYFVAVRINPEGSGFALKSGPQKKAAIAPSTRSKLAKGELHPLVLSFPSAKCVFPLAISAVNGKPSEVSLYVLSAEPLMSRVIFEKQFQVYRRERAQWLQGRPKRVERKAASPTTACKPQRRAAFREMPIRTTRPFSAGANWLRSLRRRLARPGRGGILWRSRPAQEHGGGGKRAPCLGEGTAPAGRQIVVADQAGADLQPRRDARPGI